MCSSCLDRDVILEHACTQPNPSPELHRLAPMYEQYSTQCLHREASQWHVILPPIETHEISHARQADPGRYLRLPVHRSWHKDIADAKGYESEPDESRRIKTQYARHYARRTAYGFDSRASRARARSCDSLKLSFTLSRA